MGPARHADGAVLGLLRLMEKRMIRAAKLSGKGWGVIATRDIPVGTLVSSAPMTPPFPTGSLDGTPLQDQPYEYDETHECLVWGLNQLVNHDAKPNCRCNRDFENHHHQLFAARDIEAGEELTIDYAFPLWFDPLSPSRSP